MNSYFKTDRLGLQSVAKLALVRFGIGIAVAAWASNGSALATQVQLPSAGGNPQLKMPSASLRESSDKAARNVEGILDNSFLVEEAYNQEAGVVQHIFTAFYGVDKRRGPDEQSWNLSFTQEWPVISQTHQFSYTIPYSIVERGGVSDRGVGDVLLNYRYQAYLDERNLRGFAPRLSLVLPTGDADRGFGDATVGLQANLPFSTAVGDRWFAHANAGATLLPDAGPSPRHNLVHFNLGGSAIYAATSNLHFMLEWVGLWNEGFDQPGESHREFEALLSPGVRRAFNLSSGAQWVLGLAAPIGLTGSAPDFGVFLYVSFEHGFLRKKQK